MKRLLSSSRNGMTLVGVVALMALLISGTALNSGTAYGQDGISGDGKAQSKSPATHMRMTMTLQAKGATVSDAIKVLSKKQKQATIKLEKLEAIEDSIKFGDVETGGQGDSSAMVRRMQQMLGNDERVKKMLKTKPPLTITAEVTADWKLEATEEVNELLSACDQLRSEVADADVGGTKDGDGLSAEQEELAEELAEMMRDYIGEEGANAGTPEFSYYRLVSAEDHDKLVSEAFESAKSNVDRLVKATSVTKGALKNVGLSMSSDSSAEEYDYYGNSTSSQSANVTRDDGTIEVVGESPGAVPYELSVSVTYGVTE